MRRTLAAATAVITAVFLCPLPARAQTRAEQWHDLAVAAFDRFEQLDTGLLKTAAYGMAGQAAWRLFGWQDPRVTALLDKIYSQANPDGGYGLGAAWDALGDGTVNSADTTYTVTLSDHVGPLLLDGYRAGVVPREKIQAVVNLLWSTPRIPGSLTAYGQCVAYSRNANDVQGYACVHNVNAGAAAFLSNAIAAGVNHSGLAALIVDIVRRETYAYRPPTDDWLYMDTRTANDPDHNSYQAKSMYQLVPAIGAEVAYQMMIRSYTDVTSPVVHLRLTALSAQPGHSADQWCTLGDQWLPEARAYQQSQTGDAGRQAQIAQLAETAAQACEEG